ncbi:MAG: DUF3592 domain-containing protein [Ruminiclostridium sp.]|nr:DUF3592 domain-containing protein [Ruminiclostridium sp.]
MKKQSKEIRQKRRSQIKAEFISIGAMLILELMIIASAVFTGVNYTNYKNNCTEPLDAVVTSVSEDRVLTHNTKSHGGNYKYITETTVTISVTTDGVFNEKTITGDAQYFKKGQKLRIYYDPGNPSRCYIEEQLEVTRKTFIALIVIAVLWLTACTAVSLIAVKRYKKYKRGE